MLLCLRTSLFLFAMLSTASLFAGDIGMAETKRNHQPDTTLEGAGQDLKEDLIFATESRLSLAAFCLSRLAGPDRMEASLQIAARQVREGNLEEAFGASHEEAGVSGATRIFLLAAAVDHLHASGRPDEAGAYLAEIQEIYGTLPPFGQEMVFDTVVDQLVKGERLREVVALTEGLSDWRYPFLMSLASGLFGPEIGPRLRDQALAMAQQEEEPGKRANAFLRLAGAFHDADETERAASVTRAALAALHHTSEDDRIAGYLALARCHARRGAAEEAGAMLERTYEALGALDGWLQTDGFVHLARAARATPALAQFHGDKIERTAFSRAEALSRKEGQNKFRLYELLAVSAAVTPADRYSEVERRFLFTLLRTIEEMPVIEWAD
jgi:hypothetical protein